MTEIKTEATIKCAARMSGTVIRGDSGIHGPPGSTEELDFGENTTQIVELTYAQCVELLGQEKADELWALAGENSEGGDFSE